MGWRDWQFRRISFVVVAVVVASLATAAESRKEDEQAIRARAENYLAAMARGDAQTLADFWLPDGDIVDQWGHASKATEIIQQRTQPAQAERPKVELTSSTIRFLTADTAIEDGTSSVTYPGRKALTPVHGRFTAFWVKDRDTWRLASLREGGVERSASSVSLADLDWMIGDWSAKTEETDIEITAHWNTNRTFLVRDFKIIQGGQVAFSGTQRIGWDPIMLHIRSWTFDADGGFGEGVWTHTGESWMVQATGVLPDGRETASTNVFTIEGKDAFTWKSTSFHSDGSVTAAREVKLTRKRPGK